MTPLRGVSRLDRATPIADAVLHEGYLLYPYRASSSKNQVRWQFGVLGPVGAAEAGVGEEPSMQVQVLVEPELRDSGREALLELRVRFLQLQSRIAERVEGDGFVPVPELSTRTASWLSWDEAVDREIDLGPFPLRDLPDSVPVEVAGGEDIESVRDAAGAIVGRLRRRRWPLAARVEMAAIEIPPAPAPEDVPAGTAAELPRGETVVGRSPVKLTVRVVNVARHDAGDSRDEAHRRSLLTAHLVLGLSGGAFCSAVDPPRWAAAEAAGCRQLRCWPVLIGAAEQRDVLLASPIILEERPQIAEQSAGELFDATEIDEILTLRVMTMTDEEKRQARATDPRAAAIIDRCDAMSPDELQQLHGGRRDAHPTFDTDVPWWDPGVDASVSPDSDSVTVNGVDVCKGSRVRVHPNRRADAQDMFFAGQEAMVTGVLHDVDGQVHVALVLVDDPASDLHEWYGRYFYFSPDELEPLEAKL